MSYSTLLVNIVVLTSGGEEKEEQEEQEEEEGRFFFPVSYMYVAIKLERVESSST
jgi:hypothetical protein